MKKKISFIFVLFVLVSVIFAASSGKYVHVIGRTKYHSEGCRTISKSKNVEFLTAEEVKEAGLEACKVCKPSLK